jgi:hypothetical protein
MSIRYDVYRIKRGDNLGDPEFWNVRFQELDLRLHARELDGQKIDTAVDQITTVALERINTTFLNFLADTTNRMSEIEAQFDTMQTEIASSVQAVQALADQIDDLVQGIIDDGTF